MRGTSSNWSRRCSGSARTGSCGHNATAHDRLRAVLPSLDDRSGGHAAEWHRRAARAGEGFCNALFVDDLVEALILAAIRPEAEGERFIVSGPEVITWSRFYETIAAAIGAPGPEYRPAEAIAGSNSGLAGN